MAINSLDDYIKSAKEILTWYKSTTRTTLAGYFFTLFDIAGQPGAGTLNIGNTANGIVPVATNNGYPLISFFGGAEGYISGIDFGSNLACRFFLFDRLFAAGAYAFNADVSLAAQPGFAARLPGGSYNGLQLWVEAVTAFTGTPSFQVNYLDQDGNTGDTGIIAAPAALTLGRCFQLPLASGDNGVQRIDRVRCTVATAGTFNVSILRPLWMGTVLAASMGDVHDFLRTGLPQIYDNSALYILVASGSTNSGVPTMSIEVAH